MYFGLAYLQQDLQKKDNIFTQLKTQKTEECFCCHFKTKLQEVVS